MSNASPSAPRSEREAPGLNFDDLGLQVPRVLLPEARVDLRSWAVVACDQHTSEPSYWQQVEQSVGDKPSTLRLMLPEVYLESPDAPERIARIHGSMHEYLASGVFRALEPGFVLVQRQSAPGRTRTGLVVALDLESYDYRAGSTSLVRATEGTIVERLPPRMKIRRKAPLELPHIMVLLDDPGRSVIEPLAEPSTQQGLPLLYDFELMAGGGRVSGRHVSSGPQLERIVAALRELATQRCMEEKYGRTDRGIFLYAMGDGNHSLATAKATWEELKAELAQSAASEAIAAHPARHALVELVNVHDPGLVFEPIHRVAFGVNVERLWGSMQAYFEQRGARCSYRRITERELDEVRREGASQRGAHVIPTVDATGFGVVRIENPPHTLPVGSLQGFLDVALREDGGSVDYIHGDDTVQRLTNQAGAVGFYLPSIAKDDLFKTVLRDGPLPRKAFSMGEAHEKRFYMEARRIGVA